MRQDQTSKRLELQLFQPVTSSNIEKQSEHIKDVKPGTEHAP